MCKYVILYLISPHNIGPFIIIIIIDCATISTYIFSHFPKMNDLKENYCIKYVDYLQDFLNPEDGFPNNLTTYHFSLQM